MSSVSVKIDRARSLLVEPSEPAVKSLATLSAAFLSATTAVTLAGVVILGAGFEVDERALTQTVTASPH